MLFMTGFVSQHVFKVNLIDTFEFSAFAVSCEYNFEKMIGHLVLDCICKSFFVYCYVAYSCN